MSFSFGGVLRDARLWLAKFRGDPAAGGAGEVANYAFIDRGVVRPTRRDRRDERSRLFAIEQGRFADYRDMWAAIYESEIVERALLSGAEDATAEPFDIRCEDARAEREIWELLERVRYWEHRLEYVALLWGVGDEFIKVDYDFAPISRRNLREIVGIRRFPEYTMFRNSTAAGGLRSLEKAYVQLQDVDLVMPGSSAYVSADGSEVYANSVRVPGMLGSASGYGFKQDSDASEWFSAEEMIHARRFPLFKAVQTGYGTIVMRSSRLAYQSVMSVLYDLVIDRNLATRNPWGVEFEQGATQDGIDKFVGQFFETVRVMNLDGTYREVQQRRASSPDDVLYVKGGKFARINDKQALLSQLEDIHLAIDRLELCFGISLSVSGFRSAKRVTGQMQERMEERAKRTIRGLNVMEETQLLRPLIDRQLFYSGKSGVKYELRFPEYSLEDRNRRSKRLVSEVQAGLKSRRTGAMELFQMTAEEFDRELTNMEEEIERIGPVIGYQAPPESLEKGKKGVENEDSATQDIADEYKTGSE